MRPLFLVAAFLWGTMSAHAAQVDGPAPSFTLKNINNESKSLSDYRGKVVLVNFWASWCAPCQQELPELSRLAAEYGRQKLVVIAINVDQDSKAALRFLSQKGLTRTRMEILKDPTSRVIKRYDPPAMPTSYLIDRNGRIRVIYSGFRSEDPALWRQAINRFSS